NLGTDVPLQLIAGDESAAYKDLSKPDVPQIVLCSHGRVQLLRGEHTAANKDVPQPIATIDNRCVGYPAVLKEDLAESATVRHAQAAGLPAHAKKLQHVGEARLTKAPAYRHQRSSSLARPGMSCQSQ